ncbi:diguanylate cyclase [Sodalis sp. RH20]|uniref:diguanylate cyclase n=1 Tax=unclassified Sodalis (in: enterobacteria) TaxID=2636512 RepID=UPI0039B4DCE1
MRKSRYAGSPRPDNQTAPSPGRPRFTLLFELGASAALLIVALIAINVWHLWQTYQSALAKSQTATMNLTQALSQHASDTFAQAEATLDELAQQIAALGSGAAQLPRLHQLFQQKTAGLKQISALSLFDATGQMIVTAAERLPAVNGYADRDYFIYHRDHPELTPRIGKVIRSRMTNALIVPISRRLNHPDGSFAGVLLESIMIDHFRSFYTRFMISDDSTLMMLLDNGTVLYRHPYNEKIIGTTIAGSPLYRDNIRQHRSGIVNSALGADPAQKLYSYTHLKQFPVIVTTGLSLDQTMADWRQDAFNHVVMTLIFIAMITVVSLVLMRQARARMRAEQQLIHAQQELRKLNRSLERLARSDGLTGLYNRRHFDLSLDNEFQRALRTQQVLGIILLDVDYFKQFNDLYGHVAGDNCLKRIGHTLKNLPLRHRDVVARYGGEEFIVLLPATDRDGALAVARRIQQGIVALNIPHQGSPAGILTSSLGVFVGLPEAGQDTPSRLVVKADSALYQAKRQGRNQICQA